MKALKACAGFSLVELAVTMLVLSFLLAGTLSAFRLQARQARFSQTQASLEEARSALLAFAAAQARLPCPANPALGNSPEAGTESLDGTGQCSFARGLLPWKSLGLAGLDAWGRRLSYEVSPALAKTGERRFSQPGSVQIFESGTASQPLVDTQSVAFAIWSHGSNGLEAIGAQGSPLAPSSDEDEHGNAPGATNAPLKLVLRAQDDHFDDQALWVSKFVFFKQLLDSGWNIPP